MNLASRNYHEKRDFPRMSVNTPISVAIDQHSPLIGMCHNLSGGGMLISLDVPVAVGAQMEVTVSSNHGHSPVLKAMTQVQRIIAKPEGYSEPCHLALKIVRIID